MFLENFAEQSQVHSLQTVTKLNALKLVDGSLSLAAFFQLSQSDTKRHSTQAIEQLSITEQANWVDSLLGQAALNDDQARNLLRKVPSDEFTQGRLICSCFNVREKSIRSAITEGYDSVEKLGDKLKCGTNCGSCRSELTTLIANEHIEPAVRHVSEIEVATQRSTTHSTSNRQLTIPIKHIEALE
jgi:assimilatory nitrate reductase catalytic subunit